MNTQWKLVPVEPTETMVINGFESEPDECFTDEEVWEQYQEMSGCQQAAFRAKLCWAAMIASAPVPPQGTVQPVMKLEAEKLLGGHGEYAVSFVRAGWLDECRRTGGEFLLYPHPDADEVARLTAERDALQLRLNETDQADAEMRVALMRTHDRAVAFAEDERPMQVASVEVIRDIAARALGDIPASDDWHMNPCNQGHKDVGAAGGIAHCYICDEKIEAATTQEAFELWNATHPAAESAES